MSRLHLAPADAGRGEAAGSGRNVGRRHSPERRRP